MILYPLCHTIRFFVEKKERFKKKKSSGRLWTMKYLNLRSEYFGVHFSEFSLDEINREFMKRVRKEEPEKP